MRNFSLQKLKLIILIYKNKLLYNNIKNKYEHKI